MNIVYVILVHKYPQQLIRLVNTLNTDNTSFLIHVDKKTKKSVYLEMLTGLSKFSNVYFLDRYDCYWGDFGHVIASLKGIEYVFKHNLKCDYIKLLTGQCYPIKSNAEINNFLVKHNGNSFIEFFALPNSKWSTNGGGLERLEYWYNVRIFHKIFHFRQLKRKIPTNFRPFGGSSYCFFSRECAKFIQDFVKNKNNKHFVNFFKNVLIPDEVFFQSILLNSSFKSKIVNNNLLYTDWSSNGPHPEILCKEHFNELSQSPCLFARKFDATQDSYILDLIDKHFLNKYI